jgi:hypothetical protein
MIPPNGGTMTDDGTRALRCALVAAGFPILPEITGLKFTSKPFADWRDRPTPFDPARSYSNRYGLLLNTAIILIGLVAFDLDIDVAEDIALALDVMQQHLGPARCVRSRANSPRRAALYRTEDSAGRYMTAKGCDGAIEVFSGPRTKLSAFGWHTSKVTHQQARMTWDAVPGNIQAANLTTITADQITCFMLIMPDLLGEDTVTRSHVPGSAGPGFSDALRAGNLDELYAAASCVPNDGPCDWYTWNRWGMALFGASGGDDLGLLAFCEWSLRNPASRHRDCFARWQAFSHCPPHTIGAGTVFKAAIQAGYRPSVAAKLKHDKEQTEAKRIANFKIVA